MSYQTAITIKEAIDNIKDQSYVLPSIQREFVWKPDQIEALFDSLMCGYPIGTFLFWKVGKTKIKDFKFYLFLRKYHERDYRHNQKANLNDNADITALLDGQQRLTSLYLALTGSYANKKPRMRRDNPDAYPKRRLHLNILKPSEELEVEYDFRFLTKDEAKESGHSVYWFDCHKILNFKERDKIFEFLEKHDLSDTSKYTRETTKFARKTLTLFYDAIHKDGTITYYLEKSEELDKVLQIFIRTNSGGTKLSYSDLLLSIATAQWKDKDARDVIHEFVDKINEIGDGFAFNKDLVLKNSLVLADFPNIKFKVDNFNETNMKTIEQSWDETSLSLQKAIELIADFGYNEKSLTATNAIIPIAYFIYKNKCAVMIRESVTWQTARNNIKKWLARALLKGVFGGQPDSIYPRMRDLINENRPCFPLEETIASYKGKSKSISFNEDEIDNLLSLKYGKPRTFCALTLLYPALNHSFIYHQDHIHPKSKITKESMKAARFSEEQFKKFDAEANGIANLQLIRDTSNSEKSDKPFKEWLEMTCYGTEERDNYLRQHHIDLNQSLEFEDFLEFIAKRKEAIKRQFRVILDVSHDNDI